MPFFLLNYAENLVLRYGTFPQLWRDFPQLWEPGMFYDTGASFYLDVRKADLPERQIRWEDYAVHFKGGSWDARDPAGFLRENRALYVSTGAGDAII